MVSERTGAAQRIRWHGTVRILHLNNEKTWRGGERQTLLLAAGLQEGGAISVIGCRPGAPLQQKAQAGSVSTLPIPGNNFGAALAQSAQAAGLKAVVLIPAAYHTRRLEEMTAAKPTTLK